MKFRISLSTVLCLFLLIPALTSLSAQPSGTWATGSVTGFTPRTFLCSAEVGGKIYVIGGHPNTIGGVLTTLEVFDPSVNSWSTPATTGMFTARGGLCASVVGGKIYVIGGADGTFNAVNKLEVFDPTSNTWSTPVTSGTFTPRYRLVSAVVKGKIYVIGGANGAGGTTAINALEVFDPLTNAWSTPVTTGTFTARRGSAIAVVADKIYVMGGSGAAANYLNVLEVFDPSTNTWSTPVTIGSLTTRAGLAAAEVNGRIYAMGGYDGATMFNIVEAFDPSTNTWSTTATTGVFTERSGAAASVVGGKIYVVGGANLKPMVGHNEVFSPSSQSVAFGNVSAAGIQLLPNPTTGLVTVHCAPISGMQVSVTNILGKIVYAKTFSSQTPELTFDLSTLPSGAYLARFLSMGSVINRTIIRK